jgi:photoactive yellow protein
VSVDGDNDEVRAVSRRCTFGNPGLLEDLEEIPLARIDEVGFGLIVMNRSGDVIGYNAYESKQSGLAAEAVMGRNFFTDVGPCTNNYLIAQRFRDCAELDEQVDYVFTFRMAPFPVRLRLMARARSARQYLAVRYR